MTVPAALDSIAALRAISIEECEDAFRPPPRLSVSEWADEHRRLPSTSAEPGRFRTSRIPYMRQIMDTLGDEGVREVVFAKSAQVAGSTCAENFVGYLIDQAPCAVLEVWPTEKALRAWSTKRLKPMIEDTACLAAKFPRSGRRDSSDSIASKEFPGGYIQALTAKSTADLRGHSARVCIAEEVDEWEGDIGDQGDPLELLRARMRTFWNGKLYIVSTPTIEGFSRIWTELNGSTWHEYWVPCPHCGTFQTLYWRGHHGSDDQDESGVYRLVWDADAGGEPIPGTCRYICDACTADIEERHKGPMLAAGEWRPRNPERRRVGFHINTLYSPMCPWDDIANAFTKARQSPTLMKTFVNTFLGLPYRESGAKLDAHFLMQRAESYGDGVDVPRGVGVLTAFVDVQGDRLELFVWGWGAGDESWVIEWQQLAGDPGHVDVWAQLDRLLLAPRRHASGAPIGISAVCVDAGYQTDAVHRFCDARLARHIIATVGRASTLDGAARKILEAPAPDKFKRTRSQRRPTYVIGVDAAKDRLESRLKLTQRDDGSSPPGYVHFPTTLDPVFYDQLTAERRVTRYNKVGRPFRVWKVLEGHRNEALDGAVGAMAALEYLVQQGAIARAQLGARAEKFNSWALPQQGPKESAKPKRRGGGWVTNY